MDATSYDIQCVSIRAVAGQSITILRDFPVSSCQGIPIRGYNDSSDYFTEFKNFFIDTGT